MIKGNKKNIMIILGLLVIVIYLSTSRGIMYGVFFFFGISCAILNCGIRYYANLNFLLKGNLSAMGFIFLYLLRLVIPVSIGFFVIRDSFMNGLVFLLGFTIQLILLPYASDYFVLKK